MNPLQIHVYAPSRWPDLWMVRYAQLAEHGIVFSELTVPPINEPAELDDPEYDFHRMQDTYLCGAGNFWLAYLDKNPIGYVGAQDVNDQIELRRMFVAAPYRRRGVGSALVKALIQHAAWQHVSLIELWTQSHGVGEQLYRRLGFTIVPEPSSAFCDVFVKTGYTPGQDEVRMQLHMT